jgi:hypothetical protein
VIVIDSDILGQDASCRFFHQPIFYCSPGRNSYRRFLRPDILNETIYVIFTEDILARYPGKSRLLG